MAWIQIRGWQQKRYQPTTNQIPFLSMPKFYFPGGGIFSRRFSSRLLGLFCLIHFSNLSFSMCFIYRKAWNEFGPWMIGTKSYLPQYPTNIPSWCWQVVSRVWYLHNYKLWLLTIQLLHFKHESIPSFFPYTPLKKGMKSNVKYT